MLRFNVKKISEFSTLVVSGMIFLISFNLLFFLLFGDLSIDLTKDKKFSLSDETIKFLDSNNQPINIKFYVTKDLQSRNPKLSDYAEYVRKILTEFKNKSNGKIDLTMVDVVPFENSQAEAEKANIKAFDFGDGVEYQFLGASFSNSYGKILSIANFYPERKYVLEDDITRLLSIVTKNRKPHLGIVSSVFSVADGDNPVKNRGNWPFVDSMKSFGYNVSAIRDTSPVIDENVDVVLVLYPVRVSTSLMYALDQYLVKGGNVVILFDAFSEERFRDQTEYYGYRSGLIQLLDKHGVSYKENLLVGDASSCRDVVMDGKKIKYPMKINITKEMLSDHPINKNINTVFYNHGSYFDYKNIDGLKASVIAKTSNNAGLILAEKITDLGYRELERNYVSTNEAYTLALLLEGKFKPYYPYPPIRDAELLSRLPLFVAEAQNSGKLLVIGDADFVNETLWNGNAGKGDGIYNAVYTSDNLLFLRNIFDYMSSSGYTNVKKKEDVKENENLIDVFSRIALGYYDKERQDEFSRLVKIKEDMFSFEESREDVKIMSVKKAKEKEQLVRKEVNVVNNLKKITYLTGEKYKFFISCFSIFVIVIIPLLMGLAVYGAYVLYNSSVIKKAKECVDDKK